MYVNFSRLPHLGRSEEALEAVTQDCDAVRLEATLLHHRCLLLLQEQRWDQFVQAFKLLLSRHAKNIRYYFVISCAILLFRLFNIYFIFPVHLSGHAMRYTRHAVPKGSVGNQTKSLRMRSVNMARRASKRKKSTDFYDWPLSTCWRRTDSSNWSGSVSWP